MTEGKSIKYKRIIAEDKEEICAAELMFGLEDHWLSMQFLSFLNCLKSLCEEL